MAAPTTLRSLIFMSALLLAGVAQAAGPSAVLYSSPLRPLDGDYLDCLIINVSNSTIRVSIDVYGTEPGSGEGGFLMNDIFQDEELGPLDPLRTLTAAHFNDFGIPRICKFTVEGGNKSAVRASACITTDSNVQPYICIPAS